jgi:hypothetical protein
MYANRLGLFDTMSEWLRALIDFFREKDQMQLVLRAHPGELSLGTRQTCEDTVRAVAPYLPPNIRFIPPHGDVNTYSLMRVADFGLVFNSTAGLEMAMRGIPVVMPVRAHYGGKGFTIDPTDREEYFAAIDRLASGPRMPRLTSDQARLAWCYFDLYVHSWPVDFPWGLASLRDDLGEWPVERVAFEGWPRFGETFERLVGRS